MEKEITVVTAFFNIKRENWGKFGRSEELYLEYFKGWAKLDNKIVVYVENEEMKGKILEFRKSIGQEKNTIVNIVDDITSIDPELYESIKNATINPVQKQFRLFPNNPEVWNYDYNYIMLLKMWCVKDAIERKQADGMIAWVDFGYNHGGAIIDKNSDFSFKWKYNFPDKINLFLIQKLDDRPIFDIVKCMDTYIMGTVIVGIDKYWDRFWNLMRISMMELNRCGLTDDDQNIILMCYRREKEIFETHMSDWQHPLMQFGGSHLKLVESKQEKTLKFKIKKIYRKLKKIKQDKDYAKLEYKLLKNKKVH